MTKFFFQKLKLNEQYKLNKNIFNPSYFFYNKSIILPKLLKLKKTLFKANIIFNKNC